MAVSSSEAVDPKWKGLYRAGGIGLLIAGLLYLVEIPLFFVLGPSFSSGDAALKNLAGDALVAQTVIGLTILIDLIFIPGVLALYLALKGINRNAMLVAAAFLSLFLVLDMAVT